MYEIDLIITLWDRTEGHIIHNSQIIPKILQFVNYPCRVVVQIDQPTEKNFVILNSLKNEGKIHELYTANHPPDHRPRDVNSIYIQAFKYIRNKWVLHIDGDMFLYRKGYDNWLEKFIQIIEQQKYNIGAICHTAPRRKNDHIFRRNHDNILEIEWISTRFFVTRSETVISTLDDVFLESDIPLEMWMYRNRIYPSDIISTVIPFNPDFLILHIGELAWWKENSWDEYTQQIINKNEILLKNIMYSDWADLYGDMRDFTTPECWRLGWSRAITDNERFVSQLDI